MKACGINDETRSGIQSVSDDPASLAMKYQLLIYSPNYGTYLVITEDKARRCEVSHLRQSSSRRVLTG